MNSSLIPRCRRVLLLASLVFSLMFAARLVAQQDQDTELSADQIVQILQENPDLLANAKSQIVAQLRNRGYDVSEKDVTDDRLFSEIRSDDRVRQMASDYLEGAGFGPQQSNEEASPQEQGQEQQTGQQDQNQNLGQGQTQEQNQGQYPGQASPTPTPSNRIFNQLPSRNNQTGPFGSRMRQQQQPESGKQKPFGQKQEQYPLRNLPALRDLYTQALPDETKLERFGASLFRNSTAFAE
ncbi:MAG TPA: hypothetical protein VFB76_07395, partial [Candidatus Angelobacter sp.]|nr:hypothetical protein [Candidatus Angelobacter sp.]